MSLTYGLHCYCEVAHGPYYVSFDMRYYQAKWVLRPSTGVQRVISWGDYCPLCYNEGLLCDDLLSVGGREMSFGVG